MSVKRFLNLALLLALPCSAGAQEPGLRTQLEARGLPADLVTEVETIAADATALGIPARPLADKAIEGWAKRVPPPRIAAVVRQYATQMARAREAVTSGGMGEPSAHLITAATQAMASGIDGGQVEATVRAAPGPEAAGPGLNVATALHAQGISAEQSVGVVVEAWRRGEPVSAILDMPSLARAMQAQGMSPAQVGQRMMQGMSGLQGGQHGRPAGVPPPEGHGKGTRGQRRP
jgi:hypothetical protein